MRKIFPVIFTALGVLLLAAFPCLAVDDDLQRVLIINSYHQGYKWSDSIVEGIEDVVAESHGQIELYIEYLDTKRNDIGKVFDNYSRLFATKYQGIHFDAVVTSDDNAMLFLMEHKKTLFPDVPVIFCGLNYPERYDLGSRDDTTGVIEDFDLRSTLEVALRLFPDTTHVAAISDSTPSSRDNAQRLEQIKPLFADKVTFIDLAEKTLEELQHALHTLPKKSIVLHMNFFRDPKGRNFNYRDSIDLVTRETKAPVFAAWEWYMGQGIFGGMIVSGYQQGVVAGEYLLRVLGGEDVASIPVAYDSPNVYMFDYEELVRFGIDPDRLPEGSVLINTPKTFYYQHKRIIWVTAALFCTLLLVILVLALHDLQKQRNERRLQDVADILETKVEERTGELKRANTRLQQEIAEKITAEEKLIRAKRELERLVDVDGLTKILNRRCFDRRMGEEWLRLKRERKPVAVIMCDIDYFKNYNDTYGHPAGDACLVQIAQCIRCTLKRAADFVARYGGEEFVVVLPGTGRAGLGVVAEQIAAAIAGLEIPHSTSQCSKIVTLSMGGAAMIPSSQGYEVLVQLADKALYEAKSSGRNTIVIRGDEEMS